MSLSLSLVKVLIVLISFSRDEISSRDDFIPVLKTVAVNRFRVLEIYWHLYFMNAFTCKISPRSKIHPELNSPQSLFKFLILFTWVQWGKISLAPGAGGGGGETRVKFHPGVKLSYEQKNIRTLGRNILLHDMGQIENKIKIRKD